jgi:uncharacterized membrane protein YbaN (DUF454 family)
METDMNAEGHSILLKLPHTALSDADLHAVATSIFQLGTVRSMTVDRSRAAALVRLKAETKLEGTTGETISGFLAHAVAAPATASVEPVEIMSWVDPRDQSISFIKTPDRVHGWRKALYLLLAAAALSLGLLGIFLPGLPTTPFVLVASYCLVRSSTRLHERLMASRMFGGILRDWHIHRGVRPQVRARAVTVVALVVAVSLLIARPPLPIVLVIAALATCGLIVICRLPSVEEAEFSGQLE